MQAQPPAARHLCHPAPHAPVDPSTTGTITMGDGIITPPSTPTATLALSVWPAAQMWDALQTTSRLMLCLQIFLARHATFVFVSSPPFLCHGRAHLHFGKQSMEKRNYSTGCFFFLAKDGFQ